MTLHHGSKHRFENFRIPNDESQLSGATNGFLGTWFIRDSHLFVAESYAGDDGFIAVIDEPDPDCVHQLDVKDLRGMHDEADDCEDPRGFYARIREVILSTGKDWIEIVEADGSAPMVICLKPELITDITWRDMAAQNAAEPSF